MAILHYSNENPPTPTFLNTIDKASFSLLLKPRSLSVLNSTFRKELFQYSLSRIMRKVKESGQILSERDSIVWYNQHGTYNFRVI